MIDNQLKIRFWWKPTIYFRWKTIITQIKHKITKAKTREHEHEHELRHVQSKTHSEAQPQPQELWIPLPVPFQELYWVRRRLMLEPQLQPEPEIDPSSLAALPLLLLLLLWLDDTESREWKTEETETTMNETIIYYYHLQKFHETWWAPCGFCDCFLSMVLNLSRPLQNCENTSHARVFFFLVNSHARVWTVDYGYGWLQTLLLFLFFLWIQTLLFMAFLQKKLHKLKSSI